MKRVYGTREQLARVLNCDPRSAQVQSRRADGFLQAGGKTVPLFELGSAATDEQESDYKALQATHGLDRVAMARKLEAKHGKNWTMFIAGSEGNKAPAPVKSPKKVAPKSTAELNVANLVAPNPTNVVSTKPTNGIF